MLCLNKEDVKTFFNIWYSLLHSINERYEVVPPFKKPVYGEQADKKAFFELRCELWEDVGLIDEFLEGDGKEMTDEEKDILRSWRDHSVTAEFAVMKHLRDYSVMMTELDTGIKLYGVVGLSEPLGAVMRGVRLPCFVETTIMPFKGRIIYDSFIERVYSPVNEDLAMKDYLKIKKTNGIMTSFGDLR